ncbi:MAG TPA: dehydrogenase, partial [Chthoniobacteraceae bacterium]
MSRHLCSLALLVSAASCLAQTPAAQPPKPLLHEKDWTLSPVERKLIDSFNLPPSPPLTPEEQLRTFKLAPGFRAELVAADPMIGEPVTMAFDERGRIWVVEMRGYMQNLDGLNEDTPNGRVVILEDTNGDGRMDKETVFLDKLVMPRAIMLRKGGAVIAEPPALYWCPDANRDDKADEKIVIHPGYTGPGDPEHKPNGLLPALDNWIYNAKSSERFRFNQAGEFIKEATAFRGQWGITQDDWGRIYYNTNSDQLRGDLLPSEYLARNSHFRGAEGVNAIIAAD